MKCILGAVLVLLLSASSVRADSSAPSIELKTWVKDHPEYVSHFKGRLIVTDDTDVNSEEVVLVGDCKVLANDSGDKGFCRRKGSKYCRVVQYVEGGQISYFAHDDLGKLMIAVRQNCLR